MPVRPVELLRAVSRICSRAKTLARTRLETLSGFHIRHLGLHGISDCRDIRRAGGSISMIFDVGANVGQSATKFSVGFPDARILCFEPVQATYAELLRETRGLRQVECHPIGFAGEAGPRTIFLTGQSTTSSLVEPKSAIATEVADIQTICGFSEAQGIERIDLLKVDAEGLDLDVLHGAREMLRRGQIEFVLVEVGFHPGDDRHVLFDDVRSFLLPMGYALFGIYDQQLEWTGEARLRYANACFRYSGDDPPGGASSRPAAGTQNPRAQPSKRDSDAPV